MAPFSHGAVRRASAAPGAHPRIDPRYCTDDRDLGAMAQGLRVARDVENAPARATWRGQEVLPGPDLWRRQRTAGQTRRPRIGH
ncbi:GMC oxidoreductase [Streptomyces sp. NPDC002088]|uniref:GMC oxidoreductase n=1 Tax=Streptomyces sp. NPDC002088 TaxID=3154665 RepID=UPI0033177E91